MAANTGMAGLAVTAVVSALVAFGVAVLFGPAAAVPPPASSPVPAPDSTESLRREVERLRHEVQELRAGRAPSAAPPAGDAPPVAEVPATRAELQAFVDQRVAARLLEAPGAAAAAADRRQRKTLDEAGAELGLSSVDLDSVKRAWRESEIEALTLVMGTPDIEAVKEEFKAAEEDPEKKAALITRAVGNMVRNLGKIATIEDRRNRELKKFLTEDQVKRLRGMNIRPTLEDEGIEDILERTFGD